MRAVAAASFFLATLPKMRPDGSVITKVDAELSCHLDETQRNTFFFFPFRAKRLILQLQNTESTQINSREQTFSICNVCIVLFLK